MIVILYIILGYWATKKTIYRNRIVITTMKDWFFSRLTYGMMFGFILIPWAIIVTILENRREI